VVGTGPEGQDVAQGPREVVTAVGINGLEETQDDPEVHGDEVELASHGNPDDRRANNAESEKHDLDRGGILGGQAEGGAVGVVQLVDGLVERAVVQRPMEPVVPGILNNEEDDNLHSNLPGGRERSAVAHAEVGCDRMEKPDLRELDGAVADKDEGGAFELFLPGRYLLLRGYKYTVYTLLLGEDCD